MAVLLSRAQERRSREGTIRDITDALLKAHNDAELEDSKNKGILDEDYLINTIVDLATAGTDTSASFLIWSFLYMAVFPEVQAKDIRRLKTSSAEKPSLAMKIGAIYLIWKRPSMRFCVTALS